MPIVSICAVLPFISLILYVYVYIILVYTA